MSRSLLSAKTLESLLLLLDIVFPLLPHRHMINGAHRAYILTGHAGDIAYFSDGDRVKGADESCRLRTYSHAGAALDAGGPADGENYWRMLHDQIFL